jgi:hypothetical protein
MATDGALLRRRFMPRQIRLGKRPSSLRAASRRCSRHCRQPAPQLVLPWLETRLARLGMVPRDLVSRWTLAGRGRTSEPRPVSMNSLPEPRKKRVGLRKVRGFTGLPTNTRACARESPGTQDRGGRATMPRNMRAVREKAPGPRWGSKMRFLNLFKLLEVQEAGFSNPGFPERYARAREGSAIVLALV